METLLQYVAIVSSTSILMLRIKEHFDVLVNPVQEQQLIHLRCTLYPSVKISTVGWPLPQQLTASLPSSILKRENFLITRRPRQWGFCEGAGGGCCNYPRFAVLLVCETWLVIERFESSIHRFHGAWIFWKIAALGSRVAYFSLHMLSTIFNRWPTDHVYPITHQQLRAD
jgi:hypothetical protein